MRPHAVIALAISFALAIVLRAQSADEAFVIRGVRVFDGTRIVENQTVVIASGKVAAIGTSVDVPAGAIDVPGAGRTLLPGLIDSHVHVGLNSVVEALQQSLAFGVTTVLDMWTTPVFSKWKEIEKADRADIASIHGAGNGATAPGGHPTQMDGGAGARFIPTVSTAADADAFVAARLAEGSDFIKIIYDDLHESFALNLPTLDEPTVAALARAAHRRGRVAVAHIGSERYARSAITAGVDGLAHLFAGPTVSPDFGKFVASKGAFVIPTLSVLRWVCGMPDGPVIERDADAMRRILPQFRGQLKMPAPATRASCDAAPQAIRQLLAAGATILAGTDAPAAGSTHGASLHLELEHLVEAGMTPTAVLAAATSVPARVFRMTDRGRIAPGLRADLLLVEGDPSTDIRATRRIAAVWKRGVRADAQANGPVAPITRLDGTTITPSEIDATVQRLMSAARVTGLGIAILNDRKVVYLQTYGERDTEKHLPLTKDSVMTAASYTKSAFAFAVMQLIEEGVLSLDRPIHEYLPRPLPEYPDYKDLAGDERYRQITLRMLLSHTVGFHNLRILNKGRITLNFDPGSRYAYSGEGIRLMQLLVETVTGKPMQDVMTERIFRPFGMQRTSMIWEPRFESNFANGYDERGNTRGPQRRTRADAAGSMQTTLADFAGFIEAVAQGKGLRTDTRTLMLSPQIRIRTRTQFPSLTTELTDRNDAIRLSYGLGWGLFWTPAGKAFFKEGHDEGWQHYTVVFDDRGIGIVIMANSSNAEGIFQELLETTIANTYTPLEWEGYVPYDRR